MANEMLTGGAFGACGGGEDAPENPTPSPASLHRPLGPAGVSSWRGPFDIEIDCVAVLGLLPWQLLSHVRS